jgi:Flp pilus assembly protein TadD
VDIFRVLIVRRQPLRLLLHGWCLPVLVAAAGCGSTSPFSSATPSPHLAQGTPPGAAVAGSTTRPPHASPMLPSASAGAAPTAIGSSGPTGAGNFLTSSWQTTTQGLARTFSVQPKVVRAYDPTSVTGNQPEVGADLYLQAGRVLQQQGNLPAAEDQFRKALAKSPRDIRVLVAIARLKHQQGSPAEAEQRYREALAIDPRSALVLNDIGLMYAQRAQTDAALDAFQRAVEIQPNNQRYRNNLAGILLDVNRGPEAFQLLAAGMGEADAHYNLGHLLAERGAKVAAVSQFEAALRRNPQMENARTMLASLQASHTNRPWPLPPTQEALGSQPLPPSSQPTNAYAVTPLASPRSSAAASYSPASPPAIEQAFDEGYAANPADANRYGVTTAPGHSGSADAARFPRAPGPYGYGTASGQMISTVPTSQPGTPSPARATAFGPSASPSPDYGVAQPTQSYPATTPVWIPEPTDRREERSRYSSEFLPPADAPQRSTPALPPF